MVAYNCQDSLRRRFIVGDESRIGASGRVLYLQGEDEGSKRELVDANAHVRIVVVKEEVLDVSRGPSEGESIGTQEDNVRGRVGGVEVVDAGTEFLAEDGGRIGAQEPSHGQLVSGQARQSKRWPTQSASCVVKWQDEGG